MATQRTKEGQRTYMKGIVKANGVGSITGTNLQAVEDDMVDSVLFWLDHVVDEDDMASNSASKVPTQQSVKAYVDDQISGAEHYRGLYTSLGALQSAIPTGNAGDFADVDPGSGTDLTRYAWDEDEGWVPVGSGGGVSGLTTGRIPFATSSTTLGDDAALSWDNTNKILNLNGMKIFTGIWDGAPNYDNLFITSGMDDWANITGGDNVGIGEGALYSLTGVGSDNIAIGANAGYNLTTGSRNISIGTSSGGNTELTYGNISIGYQTTFQTAGALGQYNVMLGFGIDGPHDGNYNVLIGYSLDIQSVDADGQLSIQNAIFGTGNTGTGTTASTGNIGIYVPAPTARLHLPAGTATANTAPLKFNSGTALGTPEDGAMEYHSSHLYFTQGSTRYQLDHAIHTDVSAEISAITEKTTPVDADLLLIEDSAASNAKKKVQRGNLFGAWSDHTPTFTGFSANPTVVFRYTVIGKICFCVIRMTAAGTSNATTTTITLPFNAASGHNQHFGTLNVVNAGSIDANGQIVTRTGGSAVADVYRSLNAAWTSSGNKSFNASFAYEIA